MRNTKLLKSLLVATALFIFAYWATVFLGVFPVVDLVPGYVHWFMAFPLADFYIAICALASAYYLSRNKQLAGLLSGMAGSGLLFLGLYAMSYGHITGLLYHLTTDEMIEIAIKIYCLVVGSYMARSAWRLIDN